MKQWTKCQWWQVILVLCMIAISSIIVFYGCAPAEERASGVVKMEPGPLTVTPHPKFGFNLVIVPAGTQIDGFTTLEPGLYMAGDGLRHVIERLGLLEKTWWRKAVE